MPPDDHADPTPRRRVERPVLPPRPGRGAGATGHRPTDPRRVAVAAAGSVDSGRALAGAALRRQVESPVVRVDLGRIAAGYGGETEQNLAALFDAAEGLGAVLLFDEAEALFGKRTAIGPWGGLLDLLDGYGGDIVFTLEHPDDPPPVLLRAFPWLAEPPSGGAAGNRNIVGVDTTLTGFVGAAARGQVDVPVAVSSLSEYVEAFGAVSVAHPMSHALSHFFANGGRNAIVVRVPHRSGSASAPITDADVSDHALESHRRGVWALRGTGIRLLCVPPLSIDHGIGDATRRAAVALGVEEGAFVILDPPSNWTSPAAVDLADLGLVDGHESAALYWPWIEAADETGATAIFAPSGSVAGVFVRTDLAEGVWKAPAGTDARLAATGLAVVVTDDEQRALGQVRVNTLRVVPQVGSVVWGGRTLSSDPVWRYVAVRRLAMFIEQSVDRGLGWTVFEPNDDLLWAEIRRWVEDFLLDLFAKGAFPATSPDGAFFVRCDGTTTTEADIGNGTARVLIGIAPVKPAEFATLAVRAKTL